MAAPAERYYAMWQQYGCCLCNVTVMERPSMRSGAASYRQSRQWAARSSSDLSEFVIASITVRLADIIEHCQHELVSADHVDQPVHQSRHVDVADECARHQVAACLGLGIERAVDVHGVTASAWAARFDQPLQVEQHSRCVTQSVNRLLTAPSGRAEGEIAAELDRQLA
jgi:hypothetical protein